MTIDLEYIPKINSNCSWQKFDNSNYLICIDDGNKNSKLFISSEVIKMLELIDGRKNISEIKNTYNTENRKNMSDELILTIFNKKLSGFGIFENDKDHKIEVKNKYIWFKIALFNDNLVRQVCKYFLFLFAPKVFKTIFILSVLLTFIPFLFIDLNTIYRSIDGSLFTNFVIINILSVIFHEFGHAAACEKFGAKSGKIGFGFYILSPVFFSDVSDAWRLKREERIMVDLGGIYVQLIVTALLNIAFLFVGDLRIFALTSLISVGILFNLNPFLKYDGYWALGDFINIPNLKEKAMNATGRFYGWIVRINKNWRPTKTDFFLVVYGSISLWAVLLFVIYMVVLQHNSIIYFPKNFFDFILEIIQKTPSSFEWYKSNIITFLPIAAFYIILFRSLISKIKKYAVQKL